MTIQVRYRQQYTGFDLNLQLDLPACGITVVLGASGSGKTTLLRLTAGLEKPLAGALKVGTEVWQDTTCFLPAHQRSVGFVFQDARLFPHLSVMQNIQYAQKRSSIIKNNPASKKPIPIDEAIELMQIKHLLARKPAHLSGGERQRVALVRALAAQPAILLMDEPLSSLDHALKAEIMPYITKLKTFTQIPMIYVTHALAEAEALGDYVVEIHHGRVIRAGVADTILPIIKAQQHWQEATHLNADEAQLVKYFRQKNSTEQQAMLVQMQSQI